MSINVRVDMEDVLSKLDGLPELRVPLSRSMAVAAGKVFRDEAKARAPVGTEGESKAPGTLRDALYLAYKTNSNTEKEVRYWVTWNAKKAPHGHLIEFGHWQTHVARKGRGGRWYSGQKKDVPKWIPAKPFLRPALDAKMDAAISAAIQRGQARFVELMAKKEGGNDA